MPSTRMPNPGLRPFLTNCACETDPDETNPTAFSSSCFEFWTNSLRERGDLHGVSEVQRLAGDAGFRAQFNERHENWEAAMHVVKRFAKSRTVERRDGSAFTRYKKHMPRAGVGFTEELRLYSLELLKKASVSDAVGVVEKEVDRVERLYIASSGDAQDLSREGECDTVQANDRRKMTTDSHKTDSRAKHHPVTDRVESIFF